MSRTKKKPYFCPRGRKRCMYCTRHDVVAFKRRRATGERPR